MNNFFFHFKFRLKKYLNKLGISFADRALMVPKMTYREVCFFTDYLTENLSALYLESGSGGSTLIANFLGFKFHSYETSEGYTAYTMYKQTKLHVSVGKVQKYGRPIDINPQLRIKLNCI